MGSLYFRINGNLSDLFFHISDTPNVHRCASAPTTTQNSSTTEAEQPRRDVLFPNPAEQRIVWPTGRSPVETDDSRIQHTSSIEDSPVKSLRKWVDGCFDNTRTGTTAAPDTPPQTPPCEIDRLTGKRNFMLSIKHESTVVWVALDDE